MIVVTFALPTESSAFIRFLKNVRRDGAMVCGELKHRTSMVEDRRVAPSSPYPPPEGEEKNTAPGEGRNDRICVLHTGVGAAKCEERLGNFLRDETPQLLIASGFCGGTTDELHPGDLVIADDASVLSQKAHAILPGAAVGKIHSANQIVDPAVDRYEIGRENGAIAIDMETEAIRRLCADRSIALLALRVISDSPAAPFPAPPNVLFDMEAQRTKFTALLAYLARDPASAIRLARFSQQITHAKTKLADALYAVIHAL
jgi:nucleoside phosphorylase